MKKIYISMFAIVLSLGLNAQNVTKGAVFTAGNQYNAPNNHVYIYAFDTDSLNSWAIDSVLGDFSNQVIADGHFVYAHVGRGTGHPQGGDRIFKYDLLDSNGTAIDSTDAIMGFKNFAVNGDKLVITRAFPATSEFVMVLDKNDLTSVIYTDTDIDFACNGIAFVNNKAYIASSTPNDSGIVQVIDLSGSVSYDGAFLLDSLSAGGQDIYIDNGNIYLTHARISPSYAIMYAGVTAINMMDSTYTSDTTGFVNGTVYSAANGFDYFNGKILANFGNPLETYEVATGTRSQLFSTYPTSAKKDPNAERYLVQTTDYFSFGQLDMYDNQGNVIHTVNTKVSGTALAMVTNFIPTAVNDTVTHNLSSLPNLSPFLIDALANDFDLDMDSLEIDTVFSTNAIIVGKMVEYDPALNGASPDTFSYVTRDVWGDLDTATIFLDFLTGVDEVEKIETSIYPNPANDVLTINAANGVINTIKIFDLTGRLVKNLNGVSNQMQINVSEFNAGVYFVQVTVNDNVETHRLVIQ